MTSLVEAGVTVSLLQPANCGFTVAWSDVFRDRFEGTPLKGVSLTFGSVTVRGEAMVTREGRREAGLPPDVRRAVRGCPRVTLHYGAEIACVDGIRTIEAVVVRHLASGRLEACNASALFLVFRTPGVVAPLARAVP